MAMKKRFYSVNGQMMGYEEGGVKKDFLTDHLGSITAEIDQTQTRTYDTRYSAYGRNNWSTGSNSGFGWVGSFGYRETGLFHMSHYVRARHYSYVTGGWSTVDPLWPDESAYGYVGGASCKMTDPAGLQASHQVGDHGPGCRYISPHSCPGEPNGYWYCPPKQVPPECVNPCAGMLGEGDVAGVVCCGGKSYLCVKPGFQPGDPQLKCAKAHEACHVRKNPHGCDDWGKYRMRGLKNGWFDIGTEKDECGCYREEGECLLTELKRLRCLPRIPGDKSWGKHCGAIVNGLRSTVCDTGGNDCTRGNPGDLKRLKELCRMAEDALTGKP